METVFAKVRAVVEEMEKRYLDGVRKQVTHF
jgi:hypothetical protein